MFHSCWPDGGTRVKVQKSPKSFRFIIWAPQISVPNSKAMHSFVVKIFQAGPKWWSDHNAAIMALKLKPQLKFGQKPKDKTATLCQQVTRNVTHM